MLRRNQSRKDRETARVNGEIMKPSTIGRAPDLLHQKAPSFCAILRHSLREFDDTVGNAFHVRIRFILAVGVVQKERGAFSSGKELLHRKDLPPISQRTLREQTKLR